MEEYTQHSLWPPRVQTLVNTPPHMKSHVEESKNKI